MPRYHFNIHDGRNEVDREGTELPDLHEARRQAIKLAAAVLDDEGTSLRDGEDWHMEVTDATGLVLFRLDFSISHAPAAASRLP